MTPTDYCGLCRNGPFVTRAEPRPSWRVHDYGGFSEGIALAEIRMACAARRLSRTLALHAPAGRYMIGSIPPPKGRYSADRRRYIPN